MSKLDEALGIIQSKPITKENLKREYRNTFTFYDALRQQHRPLTCPLLSSVVANLELLPNKVYNLWNSDSIGNASIYDLRDTVHELVLQETNAAKESVRWIKSRNTTLAGMFEVACIILSRYDDRFKNNNRYAVQQVDEEKLFKLMEEYEKMEVKED